MPKYTIVSKISICFSLILAAILSAVKETAGFTTFKPLALIEPEKPVFVVSNLISTGLIVNLKSAGIFLNQYFAIEHYQKLLVQIIYLEY